MQSFVGAPAGRTALPTTRLLSAKPSHAGGVASRRCLQVRASVPDPILKEKSATDPADLVFNPTKAGAGELQKVEQVDLAAKDSITRMFYTPDSEQAVNEQINHEYTMSYVYHQMASYFSRDTVALPGLSAFFKGHSLEERDHAQQLMDFQATRGGRVKLATITAPETEYNHPEKGDALHAMEISLALEKLNFQYLYKLHEVAEKAEDAQFADFVESMLADQANGVKEVADFVSQLRRVGKGHGVYHWDKDIAERGHDAMAQVSGTA